MHNVRIYLHWNQHTTFAIFFNSLLSLQRHTVIFVLRDMNHEDNRQTPKKSTAPPVLKFLDPPLVDTAAHNAWNLNSVLQKSNQKTENYVFFIIFTSLLLNKNIFQSTDGFLWVLVMSHAGQFLYSTLPCVPSSLIHSASYQHKLELYLLSVYALYKKL